MGRFFRPVLWLTLVASIGAGLFLVFSNQAKAVGYSIGDVLISEFRLDGAQWVELANTTDYEINLGSSVWQFVSTVAGPGSATSTLSGIIPAKGLLTFETSGLPASARTMLSLYADGTVDPIYAMSYGGAAFGGEPNLSSFPGAGESAALIGDGPGASWSVTTSITKGWFNNAVDYACPLVTSTTPPTLSSIASCILTTTGGVTTNLDSMNDASAMTGLYFDKVNSGRITFDGTVNFTDQEVVNAIASLGESLNIYNGILQFPSDIDTAMGNLGASLTFYGVDDMGFDMSEIPDVAVFDDDGNALLPGDTGYPSLTGFDLNTSTGDLTFNTDHFTEIDLAISVTEVTPVPTPDSNTEPVYTFNTNVASTGNISYGGDCSSVTTDSVAGDNIITFNTLAPGLHDNCTITVSAFGGAIPKELNVSPFTVTDPDTAAVAADKEALTADAIKGTNYDLLHVTQHLTDPLPSLGANGSTITWTSHNESYITNDGQTVNRPAFGDGDLVGLDFEATITKGVISDTKFFSITVLQETGVISEVTPVGTYTTDNTPSYQYALTEAATVSGAGDCADHMTNYAGSVGTNNITFWELPEGVYNNCVLVAKNGSDVVTGQMVTSPFTVDTIAPTSTATAEGGYTFGNWTNDDVTVTFGCTDDGSGCETTYHCVDYSDVCTPDTATDDVLVSGENTFYVRYFSRDSAGNTEDVQSVQIKLDKTGPNPAEISNVYLSDTTEVSSGGNVSGTIKILDVSSDGDSGMNRVEFRYSPSYELIDEVNTVNGDGYYETNLDTTGLSNGTYDIIGRAFDMAGNYTDSSAFQIVVENEELGNIQSLIDAADPGDTVTIPAGTYYENISINKQITLIGDIGTDVLGAGPSAPVIINSTGNRTVNITASGVVFRGFIVENADNYPAVRIAAGLSSVTVSNNDLRNSYSGVTVSSGSSYATLTKNKIYGNYYGIFINDSTSNVVSNNEIYDSGSNGIEFVGYQSAGDNDINHNNIHDNTDNGVHFGSNLDNSEGAINVGYNTIDSNGLAGVRIDSGTSEISIVHNTIANNGQHELTTGIHVISAYGNSAHFNTITSDMADTGINNEDEVDSFDAAQNYWGTEAGPYEAGINDGGNPDSSIIGSVSYSPWYSDAGMTSLRGLPDEDNSYTLSGGYDVTSDGYNLSIPAGTEVTGSTDWTGDINPPTITTLSAPPSRSGYTTTMDDIIEVGFADGKLILSQAARLTFPGAAGKHVGYSRPGISFTEITAVCGEDDQLWADENLGTEGDCKKDSGEDLVIWTKHFTIFATYDQTQNYSGGGGSATYNQVFPTNPVVVINSGDTSADSANVTLTLSATGATEMAVANTSDFAGASWETFSASKSWTLFSGVGLKTVYVKFRNASGNSSEVVSDTISLTTSEGGVTPSAGTNETTGAAGDAGSAPGQASAGDSVGGIPEFPTSSVVMGPTNATSTLQPGSKLSFSYSYSNETSSTLYVKINRELLNSKGRVVKKLTAYKTIKKGTVFKANIKEMLSPTLASGIYTMRVKIYNARTGKLLGVNSFKIVVKKKFYTFSALPVANEIAFNEATFKKMKKSVALPGTVWMRYSYTNSTAVKQSIKMIRELVGPDGKVLSSRYGRWSMVPGEKDTGTFAQYISGKLATGDYRLRVRALDWKTGALIAENALSFIVEMK